jgi:diphthine-ammonia ligase
MQSVVSWSGGKDSCYATIVALGDGYVPKCLLTTINENGKISRSHGIPISILQQQANAMNLPLHTIATTWQQYEENYIKQLQQLTQQYILDAAVFGDIDIVPNRAWEEKVSATAHLEPYLPLWGKQRLALAHDIIDNGIEAIIISCSAYLGKDFLGLPYNKNTLEKLANANVDLCGENGEFHTLVTNCTLFNKPIIYQAVAKHQHEHYCFLEIQ